VAVCTSVPPEYCALRVEDGVELIETPVPPTTVTRPELVCARSIRAATPNAVAEFGGTVAVIFEPLVNTTISPASVRTNRYVVPD
jgi:hypothetical protein